MSVRRITVVKIGGSVLERTPAGEAILDCVADAWRSGEEMLVVHGGGAELSRWLERLGIATRFVDGQRVTDGDVLQLALMVLGGLVNRRVVEGLVRRGCPAVGLTGADGSGTLGLPIDGSLGGVGRIVTVNAPFYFDLIAQRRLPVVASLALCADRGWLNVNADLMAAALASGLRARRLFLMTDVEGVLDESGTTIPTLTATRLDELIANGGARDGMIPKLRACREALQAQVDEILIAPVFPDSREAVGCTRVVADPLPVDHEVAR